MRSFDPVLFPPEMHEYVGQYVNAVLANVQPGDTLLIEQRVPIGHITGEAGATGTVDAVIVKDAIREIQDHDLKYGVGVKVFASEKVPASEFELTAEGRAFLALIPPPDENGDVEAPNPQLGMYGLGALHDYELVHEFDTVRLFIHQPRLDHISEFVISRDALVAWGEIVKKAADQTRAAAEWIVKPKDREDPEWLGRFFNPGEKQCRWCRVKHSCVPLANYVTKTVANDLEDISEVTVTTPPPPDQLGVYMTKVDLVEGWCRGVRAAVEAQLVAGKPVSGWKLVEGRRGSRNWIDEKSLVKMARKLKIKAKQLYEKSLISPTTAEKLLKKAAPESWEKLQGVITQSKGKPSVAPAKDPRPAYTASASAEDITQIEE